MILSIGLMSLVAFFGVSPWFLLLLIFTWIPDLVALSILNGD